MGQDWILGLILEPGLFLKAVAADAVNVTWKCLNFEFLPPKKVILGTGNGKNDKIICALQSCQMRHQLLMVDFLCVAHIKYRNCVSDKVEFLQEIKTRVFFRPRKFSNGAYYSGLQSTHELESQVQYICIYRNLSVILYTYAVLGLTFKNKGPGLGSNDKLNFGP